MPAPPSCGSKTSSVPTNVFIARQHEQELGAGNVFMGKQHEQVQVHEHEMPRELDQS